LYSYATNTTRYAVARSDLAYAPLLTRVGPPNSTSQNAPLWSANDGTTTTFYTVDPAHPGEAYGKMFANAYLDTVQRVMQRPLDGSVPFCPYPNGWGRTISENSSDASTNTNWITPRTNYVAISRHPDDLMPTTYLGDPVDPQRRSASGYAVNGIAANYAWWTDFWTAARDFIDAAVGHTRTPVEFHDDMENQGPDLNDILLPISTGSVRRKFDLIKADARWSTELVDGVWTWEDFYNNGLTTADRAAIDNAANNGTIFSDALTLLAEKLGIWRDRCHAHMVNQSAVKAARDVFGSRFRQASEYSISASAAEPGTINDRTVSFLSDRIFENRGPQTLPPSWVSAPLSYQYYGLRDNSTAGNLNKLATALGYTRTGSGPTFGADGGAAADGRLFNIARLKENIRRIRATGSPAIPWWTYNRYSGLTTGIVFATPMTADDHLSVLREWRRLGVNRIIVWGNPSSSAWVTDFGPFVDNILPELPNL